MELNLKLFTVFMLLTCICLRRSVEKEKS